VAAEGAAIIGHAMAVYRTAPDGTLLADLGVVVADEWQDQGIGTALMRMLTGRALAMGASAAVMDVLAENRRMLALIKRRWPDASYDLTGMSVTVHAGLRRRAAPAAGEFSQPQKGRRGDNDGRQARHPAAHLPVGGSRHLRGCGA
jgi:GNAT superfamily N-acetyltransferase